MTKRNCTKTLFTLAALAMVAFVTASANADLVISGAAPTVDGADIANLIWAGGGSSKTTKTFNDTPNPGQSFTTGNNAGGYTIDSFSFQNNSNSDMTTGHGARTWDLRLIEITGSGGSATSTTVATATGISQAAGTFSSGDWFTFSFDSLVGLSANSVYGVDIEHKTGGDWPKGITYMRHNDNNDVSGGQWYQRVDGDPGTFSNYTQTGRDFVFHANLSEISAVPEPGSLALFGLGSVMMLVRRRRG